MKDVDFQEEENWMPTRPFENDNTQKGLVGFLLKKRIVKTKKQANYVLFGIAGLFFLITLIFVIKAL